MPVTYAARSEQRNAIAFAMSCGSPGRLKTVRLAIRSFIAGLEVEGLGADDPRHDRVAGDAVAAPLHRERLGQPEKTRLRRRVARLAEAAERPRDRGHVHDPPPLPSRTYIPPEAGERAREVDPEVALPELGPLIVELADVVERPGVVDEDVDRAELGDDTLDRPPPAIDR